MLNLVEQNLSLIKPDQYNVETCEEYFKKLKPGLVGDVNNDDLRATERLTIDYLCEARTAELSRFNDSYRRLSAAFVKAVVESNQFDAPGYNSISISGATIVGDLDLSKIIINNALFLNKIDFEGSVDFSYSSTAHNLDVSGKLPEAEELCLKGFQTTASVFIYDFSQPHNQPDKQPAKKSTPFCTDNFASASIGLQGARIGGELGIRKADVKLIDAEGAQIVGQVLIQDSAIFDHVDFSAASAGGFFFIRVKSPTELKSDEPCGRPTVFLEATNVLGSAEFVQSELCGISMTGAHVSKNVNFLGSKLGFFDFTGSNADGDLQIGPSRGPPGLLPVWLPPSGTRPNLVLSHSSVTLVRVALNNWPDMCDIGMNPEDRPKVGCAKPGTLTIDYCTDQKRLPPSDLPDRDDAIISISKLVEWTGMTDLAKWLFSEKRESRPTTIVADFRFKAFGKPIYCAWTSDADPENKYRRSDYISNDITIDETEVKLWLASTQYSPAEYQLVYDLLTTNGQSPDARKIGYAGKNIETRLDFVQGSLPSAFTMLLSRWIIGYGYCPYLAIVWAIVFCVIGALVFSWANPRASPNVIRVVEGEVEPLDRMDWRKYVFGPLRFRVWQYSEALRGTKNFKQDYGVINPFGFSFDALLPIIRLRELHYQIELGGWRHYYFYVQRIVGWILGIFVLAAFSGLTK